MSGCYIALEGIDGSGKSTIHKLLRRKLFNRHRNISFIREPGTTKFAEKIRKAIFSNFDNLKPITIQLAMLAARSDINIKDDFLTISDRCFLSVAYCEELQKEKDIRKWLEFSFQFINKPNVIIFFDISEKTSVDRIGRRKDNNGYDTDDLKKIKERIRSYKRWIRIVKSMSPEIKIITIDANREKEEVLKDTLKIIEKYC